MSVAPYQPNELVKCIILFVGVFDFNLLAMKCQPNFYGGKDGDKTGVFCWRLCRIYV